MTAIANIPSKRVSLGKYSAFVPASLPPKLDWTPRLIRVLSDADRMIGRLAGEGGRLTNPHVLMRLFVRREAVLSMTCWHTGEESWPVNQRIPL